MLVISGEYPAGMIRSSLMAVPHRLPMLWAKIIVFGAVTFGLMLLASLASFYAVQAIVAQHHEQVTLAAPHALTGSSAARSCRRACTARRAAAGDRTCQRMRAKSTRLWTSATSPSGQGSRRQSYASRRNGSLR